MKTTFCLVQDKYKCICLGMVQPKKPVWGCNVHIVMYKCTHCHTVYTLYILYNVHTVQPQLMETSSAVLCTHTVQPSWSPTWQPPPGLGRSHRGPWRGQLTASPATRWEGLLSRVLLPFPCFQGFPALEGLGKQLPPGRGSLAWVKSQARLPPVFHTMLAL